MFGKKKQNPVELSPEEIKRKEIIQKRCNLVLIGVTILLLIYLAIEMIVLVQASNGGK